MRVVAVQLALAVMLFAAAAICWTEAQLTRRVAAAHERFATLRYNSDDEIFAAPE
jgi:hypothetical protein